MKAIKSKTTSLKDNLMAINRFLNCLVVILTAKQIDNISTKDIHTYKIEPKNYIKLNLNSSML